MLIVKYGKKSKGGNTSFQITTCDEVINRHHDEKHIVDLVKYPTLSAQGNHCSTETVLSMGYENGQCQFIYVENMGGRTVQKITPTS